MRARSVLFPVVLLIALIALPNFGVAAGAPPAQAVVNHSFCGWVLLPGTPEQGIGGAAISLQAWDGASWTAKGEATSAAGTGFFSITYSGPAVAGFALEETNPAGYESVSATGPAGWVVVGPDRVEERNGASHGCLTFYDQVTATPTATAVTPRSTLPLTRGTDLSSATTTAPACPGRSTRRCASGMAPPMPATGRLRG